MMSNPGAYRRRPFVVKGWRVLGSRSGTAIAMGASDPTVGASALARVPSAPAPLTTQPTCAISELDNFLRFVGLRLSDTCEPVSSGRYP